MTVTLTVEDDTFLVQTEGHAKTAEVCAGASAIMQTLEGWLINSEAVILKKRIKPGDCEIAFSGRSQREIEKCQTAFEFACVGFLRLQETAPDEVQVTISDNTEY